MWEATLRPQSLLYGGPWLSVAARAGPQPFYQPKNEARDPPQDKAQDRPSLSPQKQVQEKGQFLSLLSLPIDKNCSSKRNQLLRNRCPRVGRLSGSNHQGPKPHALSHGSRQTTRSLGPTWHAHVPRPCAASGQWRDHGMTGASSRAQDPQGEARAEPTQNVPNHPCPH